MTNEEYAAAHTSAKDAFITLYRTAMNEYLASDGGERAREEYVRASGVASVAYSATVARLHETPLDTDGIMVL